MISDRVNELIECYSCKDSSDIEDAWCKYLEQNLQFPFEAKITDEPGPLTQLSPPKPQTPLTASIRQNN
jgi:hypothetical protein